VFEDEGGDLSRFTAVRKIGLAKRQEGREGRRTDQPVSPQRTMHWFSSIVLVMMER
jgi:hypothetical protein